MDSSLGGVPDPSYPTLEQRVAYLFDSSTKLYERHPELTALIPPELHERGRRLATRLALNSSPSVLLHGDLTPSTVPPLAVGTRPETRPTAECFVNEVALGDRLGDCAPQHDREVGVEARSFLRRERSPLPHVRDRARERADTDRERKCVTEVSAPRLEVRVSQPREPRVARR
jgi:hypothetical protein